MVASTTIRKMTITPAIPAIVRLFDSSCTVVARLLSPSAYGFWGFVVPPDILAKLNECTKTDLIGTRDWWFRVLKWSTTAVAAGLVLELPELGYELTDIARNRIQRLKYRFVLSEAKLEIFKVVAFIGWFFIVAGVVGERYAEVRVNDLDASIQGCNAARLTEVKASADDATADAVSVTKQFGGLHEFVVAKERELDTQFGALKQYADAENKRTETVIAELNKDRQKLDKSRTDAIAAADEAKEALAAVNTARKPRILTEEQQERIARKMAVWATIPNSKKVQSVAVFPTTGTFESAHLADQIAAALSPGKAGWRVTRYPVTMGVDMAVSGVGMWTSSNARGRAIATALAEALGEEGIAAFVIPQKWKGCEDNKVADHPDTDPWCSHFSVIVGDHP